MPNRYQVLGPLTQPLVSRFPSLVSCLLYLASCPSSSPRLHHPSPLHPLPLEIPLERVGVGLVDRQEGRELTATRGGG